MATHELRTFVADFEAVKRGARRADVRLATRDFQPGDEAVLREWDVTLGGYTGREIYVTITWVQSGAPLPEDIVVLSIQMQWHADRPSSTSRRAAVRV